MARMPSGGGRKQRKPLNYFLPMNKSGWRGAGERTPNEGSVTPPNRRYPRGRNYARRTNRPT